MTKQPKLRKADIQDLDSVIELNHRLFEREYENYDQSVDLSWSYSQKAKQYFRRRIEKESDFVEVLEGPQKLVGYLCGGPSKRVSYRKQVESRAELENMFIEEDFRRQGWGTKMVKNFISWCKNRDIKEIGVKTHVPNKAAVNFYQKCGFTPYKEKFELRLEEEN